MVRKQVYLTVAQNERLRRAAKQLRRSEAELLREAIDQHLSASGSVEPKVEDDPLFQLIGIGPSEDAVLSERVDEVLYGKRSS